MNDEPIAYTQRYVAPEDGRLRLSWASVRFTLRSRGHLLFYATIVVFGVVVGSLEGGRAGASRGLETTVGLIVTGFVVTLVWTVTVGFAQTYSSTKERFFPGAVLESGFGSDVMALRAPSGESRIPFAAMRRVRTHGEFAFVSTDGIGGQAVFPRALFPDDQVARINAAHG